MSKQTGQKRQRIRLDFEPEWSGVIEGYTVKRANEAAWRYAPEMEVADLVNEGWLVFNRVRETYPLVVDPPHFTALYKRALENRLTDISRSLLRKRNRGVVLVSEQDELDHFDLADPRDAFEEKDFELHKEEAPIGVLFLIEAIELGASTRLRRRNFAFQGESGATESILWRETRNTMLCRLAGMDPTKTNLHKELGDWICEGARKTDKKLVGRPGQIV